MIGINVEKTGQNIRNHRKKLGIMVRQLQGLFGFNNPCAIYKWEQGKAIPQIDNLVILASIFNTSIEDILVVEGKI